MKKKISILTVLFGILGTGMTCFAGSVCHHVDIDWVSSQIKLPADARIALKREKHGLCEIILAIDGNLAPLYAGNNFVLAGQLFKDRRPITRETMNTLPDLVKTERKKAMENHATQKKKRQHFFKNNIRVFDELVSFIFNGEGDGDCLYVVTDPDCSHCKDLLSKLEPTALAAGIKLKIIIYPVLGSKSRDMAAQAICGDYSYSDYTKMRTVQSPPFCERSERLLEKTISFFQSARISSTPMVVAGDGSWVVDANDIHKIQARLGMNPAGQENESSGGNCTAR